MKTAVHAPMDAGVAKRYRGHRSVDTFLFLLLLILFFIIIIFLLFFNTTGDGYRVVKLSGNVGCLNFSRPYNLDNYFIADTNQPGAVLVKKGDILALSNILYQVGTDEDSFHVSHAMEELSNINGRVASIEINDTINLLPWFRQMKRSDIKDLRSITFSGNHIPLEYYPYLQKIAKERPHTSIILQVDSLSRYTDLEQVLKLFSPYVLLAPISDAQLPLLANCKDLQVLFLFIDSLHAPLPKLPSLRQCILLGENSAANNPLLFINNPQVERITTSFTKAIDYSKHVHALKELHLIESQGENVDMATLLQYHPNLTALTLGATCKNLQLLPRFKHLRWLGLPESITQKELDELLPQLSTIQVLGLKGRDSTIRLAYLPRLSNLQSLIIIDTLLDVPSLLKCKQLTYLSLPVKAFENKETLAVLQKALPNCIIVPNAGACLGSGWLLLLPLLVLLISIFRYLKTTTYDQKA